MPKNSGKNDDPLGDYTGQPSRPSQHIVEKALPGTYTVEDLPFSDDPAISDYDGTSSPTGAEPPMGTIPASDLGMAMIAIRPEMDPRVLALYQEAQELLKFADLTLVDAPEKVKLVSEHLVLIQGLKKAIEEKRKEYTTPLNDHLRAFNASFQSLVSPLTEADQILRRKILAYNAEEDRKRKAEEEINRKRIEAAQEEMALKGELTEEVGLVEVREEPATVVRTDVGNLATKMVWKFEIIDFSKLPDAYKLPDEKLIRGKVISLKTEGEPIPGVRAWQEPELQVTKR